MKIYARENPTSPKNFVGKPVWVRVEYYCDGFDEPSDSEYFKFHSIEGDIAQVNMLPTFCIEDLTFHVRYPSSDFNILRDTFVNPLAPDNLFAINMKLVKVVEPVEILSDEEVLNRAREICEGEIRFMKIYANRTAGSELDKYVGNDMWLLASVRQCELIDRTIFKLGGHSFDWYCWIKLLYTRDGYYYFYEVGTPFRTDDRLPNAVPIKRVSWADRKLEKPKHMRATADNIKIMHPIEMYSDEELFSEVSE